MIPPAYISLAQLLLTLLAVGFSVWLFQRGKAEKDGADGAMLARLTEQIKGNAEALTELVRVEERSQKHADEILRLRDVTDEHAQRLAQVEARCQFIHRQP